MCKAWACWRFVGCFSCWQGLGSVQQSRDPEEPLTLLCSRNCYNEQEQGLDWSFWGIQLFQNDKANGSCPHGWILGQVSWDWGWWLHATDGFILRFCLQRWILGESSDMAQWCNTFNMEQQKCFESIGKGSVAGKQANVNTSIESK